MKTKLAAFVLLVWTIPGLAREPDVRAQVDPEALRAMRAQLLEAKAGLQLPRVALFNQKGQLIYTQIGNRENLSSVLRHQMRMAAPEPDAVTLRQLAEFWLPPKGVEEVRIKPAQFYLVEYWAAWCAPCKKMERDIAAWLTHKPTSEVLWISVEEDLRSVEEQQP